MRDDRPGTDARCRAFLPGRRVVRGQACSAFARSPRSVSRRVGGRTASPSPSACRCAPVLARLARRTWLRNPPSADRVTGAASAALTSPIRSVRSGRPSPPDGVAPASTAGGKCSTAPGAARGDHRDGDLAPDRRIRSSQPSGCVRIHGVEEDLPAPEPAARARRSIARLSPADFQATVRGDLRTRTGCWWRARIDSAGPSSCANWSGDLSDWSGRWICGVDGDLSLRRRAAAGRRATVPPADGQGMNTSSRAAQDHRHGVARPCADGDVEERRGSVPRRHRVRLGRGHRRARSTKLTP